MPPEEEWRPPSTADSSPNQGEGGALAIDLPKWPKSTMVDGAVVTMRPQKAKMYRSMLIRLPHCAQYKLSVLFSEEPQLGSVSRGSRWQAMEEGATEGRFEQHETYVEIRSQLLLTFAVVRDLRGIPRTFPVVDRVAVYALAPAVLMPSEKFVVRLWFCADLPSPAQLERLRELEARNHERGEPSRVRVVGRLKAPLILPRGAKFMVREKHDDMEERPRLVDWNGQYTQFELEAKIGKKSTTRQSMLIGVGVSPGEEGESVSIARGVFKSMRGEQYSPLSACSRLAPSPSWT